MEKIGTEFGRSFLEMEMFKYNETVLFLGLIFIIFIFYNLLNLHVSFV